MDQEKFGKFIKQIRKDHNLTQKQLAEKYNVTYQAVSKWETGKNMPDISLIKQIAKDFDVSIDELFDGEYTKKKKQKIPLILIVITTLILISILFIVLNKDKNFEFKTLSSSCPNFNISGSISYNKSKTAIYISNINYCGRNDETEYKNIECTLYEKDKSTIKRISSCKSKNNIKLEEFLKNTTISSDNYSRLCKEYKENNLYLEINATNKNGKIITYKVPLKLDKSCSE